MYISFWRPPSWISGGCSTSRDTGSGTIKNGRWNLLLCVLELEILYAWGKIPPFAGKRRNVEIMFQTDERTGKTIPIIMLSKADAR